MPVKRASMPAHRAGVAVEIPLHEPGHGEGQGRGAVQDRAGQTGRARHGEVGMDGIPDARALGVDVGEVVRHVDALGPARRRRATARWPCVERGPARSTRRRRRPRGPPGSPRGRASHSRSRSPGSRAASRVTSRTTTSVPARRAETAVTRAVDVSSSPARGRRCRREPVAGVDAERRRRLADGAGTDLQQQGPLVTDGEERMRQRSAGGGGVEARGSMAPRRRRVGHEPPRVDRRRGAVQPRSPRCSRCDRRR